MPDMSVAIPAPRPVVATKPQPGPVVPGAKPEGGPVAEAPVLSGKPPGRIPGEQPRENGKFVSPNGKPAEAKDEKPPEPKPEPAKEPWRKKFKVKVYGQEEDVELDEETVEREARELRAFRKRFKESDDTRGKALRILEMAKEDPEAFLREAGHDPSEWSQKKIAEQVRLETMTEQERKAHDIEQENARLKADLEKRERTETEARRAAATQRAREENVKRYGEALKVMGEKPTNELIYLMAEVDRQRFDQNSPLYGITLTPEQLGREAVRQMDGFAGKHFGSLDGPDLEKKVGPYFTRYLDGLKKPDPAKEGAFLPDGAALAKLLGPKRVQALLEASIAEWEASQNFEPKPADPPPPARIEEDKPREMVDEYEIDRRRRAMLSGK